MPFLLSNYTLSSSTKRAFKWKPKPLTLMSGRTSAGQAALTTCRYLLTFSWSVVSRKLKILSMFWVNVCWMSLLLWGGSVWKVTTSSANRRRMNMTSSVCVSYANRKSKSNQTQTSVFTTNTTKGYFLLAKPPMTMKSQPCSSCREQAHWIHMATVLPTPCLESVSNSISMSGQCCGHSRLIISTTIRDRTSLMWFSSSKMFNVPWKWTID